ncbi:MULTISPECIES: hypothetical protein [unclassified Microcoleus]|nr:MULTISPECIES: hypothetical protein [unclassified Microcoleus]
MLEQNRSLGEQAIDKVAEIAIASRLDGTEMLPLYLLQSAEAQLRT